MCLFFLLIEKSFVQENSLAKKVLHKFFEAMHRLNWDCWLTMASVQHTMRFDKLIRFGATPVES
jgi:hypothetical protein